MIKNHINLNNKKYIHTVLDIIHIVLGTFLIAIGTNFFLLPRKMTVGGVSGIATIFYYVFKIPLSITIIILNIPLFIVAIKKLDFKFNAKTIFATIMLSFFLQLLNNITIFKEDNLDLFTSCVFGGLIVGVGLAIIFKAGASSGGSDLLAQLIYKLTKAQSISKVLLTIEICIILSIILVFRNINIGLYSVISMVISTKVVDVLFEGIYYTRVVTIITRKEDKVIPAILNNLQRGATLTNSIGAHTKEEIATITCVITTPQIAKIKELIRENDSNALLYITTVNEAIGAGFKELK